MNLATPNEKVTADGRDETSVLSGHSIESQTQTWGHQAELKARRKVDLSVVPLLFLGLTVFQLDRMNLASALTGGLKKDLKIDQSTLGPRKWISAQVLVFGFIATLQVFITNRNGFLVVRSILGLCETGYIPGSLYTLSTWFTKRELAKRVGIFFFGMFFGNAISPVLASGILRLNGKQGLKGWQWIFLIEGVFTMAVPILLFFVLPRSPDNPKPLLSPGLIRFTEEDRSILQSRLELYDPEKKGGAQGMRIKWALVAKTVLHYKRWSHYLSTGAVFATWSPLTTYTPSIVFSLGFNRTSANALASVGGFIALGVVFIFSYLSDRTNKRGATVILAQLCYLIVLIVAYSVELQGIDRKWSQWGLWTAVNAFAVGYHPVHNSWLQLNYRSPGEQSVAVAMWVMSAISGLMAGTQIFQGKDAPLYYAGLRAMINCVSCGIALALFQEWIYWTHNKNVRQGRFKLEKGEIEPRIYVL